MGQEERLYTDPVGFSTMPITLEGKTYFVIGMRVEGYYDNKKTKAKVGSDFNPVFPLAAFIDTITKFRTATPAKAVEAEKPKPLTASEKFVSFTMHEIRRLNLDVKAQAEEMTANLNKGYVDKVFLDYRAQNIFGTSSLISIRLNSYDFHVNPDALVLGGRIQIPIFKKFEKIKHCLQVECGRRKVQIKLDGQSFHSINGYDVFELLPFVLLENAIKYSPPEQSITVSFIEGKHQLEVIIKSIGPILSEDEQKHLFEADFRGENAKKTCNGSGTGLHFAKLVCDLHSVGISARSEQQENYRINGVPYSYFAVSLEIIM